MTWERGRPTHVPTTVRTACLNRDGHQCTQTMRNGQRCPETTNLEAAHWNAWQPGETITVDHVRTLCHWHHNRETQKQAAQARGANQGSVTHPRERHPGLT